MTSPTRSWADVASGRKSTIMAVSTNLVRVATENKQTSEAISSSAGNENSTLSVSSPLSIDLSLASSPMLPGIGELTKDMAKVSLDGPGQKNKWGNSAMISSTPDSREKNMANKNTRGIRENGGRAKQKWNKFQQENKKKLAKGVAATQFHSFPLLPGEIRIAVWEYASLEGRIIELEFGLIPDNGPYRHCPRQVTRACRISPTIMRICSESREVGKMQYTRRNFDSKAHEKSSIWFNKDIDIVYFGGNTCIMTLAHTCRDPAFQGEETGIAKIAVDCSRKGEMCCDLDDDAYWIDGGIDTMQALHGFDESISSDFQVNIGLKEVYFVVKSKLWPNAAQPYQSLGKGGVLEPRVQLNPQMTFRPATSNGLTNGQARFRTIVEAEIKNLKSGFGINGVGVNKWVGGDLPNFHFVSVAPKTIASDSRVYDGTCVQRGIIRNWEKNGWRFLRGVEKSSGCVIRVPPQEYHSEDPREIGFFGTRASVDSAKAAIQQHLDSRS